MLPTQQKSQLRESQHLLVFDICSIKMSTAWRSQEHVRISQEHVSVVLVWYISYDYTSW